MAWVGNYLRRYIGIITSIEMIKNILFHFNQHEHESKMLDGNNQLENTVTIIELY
ncbi:hypothetical protein Phum_PHUM090830 [Pediculus humanus corporis]|uniref:Uncharacterized protein n=1 Tax=Pediculus humanus subsp. corporis TaxID=121224 RepID=E0VCM8_PEDHC|nr:uncharacterized protein Phum_PHUM090830 [Pediculus humanus corporis]EEB11134.1 hypothetical protein Phum_PHUM090830 [Pediculus humanus corporis]